MALVLCFSLVVITYNLMGNIGSKGMTERQLFSWTNRFGRDHAKFSQHRGMIFQRRKHKHKDFRAAVPIRKGWPVMRIEEDHRKEKGRTPNGME